VVLTRRVDPLPSETPVAFRGNDEIESFLHALPGQRSSTAYLAQHLDRFVRTIALIPPPVGNGRALELGAYLQMTPAVTAICGYRSVRGADFGSLGETVTKTVSVPQGEFTCEIDLFDAERDRFPYPDGSFELVLCCEILEHLLYDPMHMLLEIRRVLHPDGALLLTTPNCASFTSLACALHGRDNPQIYACYSRDGEGRPHIREYTAHEVRKVLECAGYEVQALFTGRNPGADEASWVRGLLQDYGLETSLRGEQTYGLARPAPGAPVERYPPWLYG
jgi:SAM-dependent methyltransferase